MLALLFWLCVGSILYTYIGYPLLLWLLARGKPEHPSGMFATPPVTLLIAAYNEASIIARKLENCLALN
jgi:cellulose synthase/poly-beta-1,6-N-acetylglucosamine synthase-like glycosyltransferase